MNPSNGHPDDGCSSRTLRRLAWSDCREMDALSRRHFYPNTTPNRAYIHLPASDKLFSFSKRLRDFLQKTLLGTDKC
jgi:hypothetical protein